jgi:hypothetical protein
MLTLFVIEKAAAVRVLGCLSEHRSPPCRSAIEPGRAGAGTGGGRDAVHVRPWLGRPIGVTTAPWARNGLGISEGRHAPVRADHPILARSGRASWPLSTLPAAPGVPSAEAPGADRAALGDFPINPHETAWAAADRGSLVDAPHAVSPFSRKLLPNGRRGGGRQPCSPARQDAPLWHRA